MERFDSSLIRANWPEFVFVACHIHTCPLAIPRGTLEILIGLEKISLSLSLSRVTHFSQESRISKKKKKDATIENRRESRNDTRWEKKSVKA